MTRSKEIRVPASQITVSRHADASIAVVGNPNSGKSTLFNRLTGLRQRIGNYPGVTVERHIGTLRVDDSTLELIDLPGTHALSAHSIEEQIAVDVILGHMEGTAAPDGVLAVVDSTTEWCRQEVRGIVGAHCVVPQHGQRSTWRCRGRPVKGNLPAA